MLSIEEMIFVCVVAAAFAALFLTVRCLLDRAAESNKPGSGPRRDLGEAQEHE